MGQYKQTTLAMDEGRESVRCPTLTTLGKIKHHYDRKAVLFPLESNEYYQQYTSLS